MSALLRFIEIFCSESKRFDSSDFEEIIEQDAPENLINMLGDNNINVRINSSNQKLDLSPFNYRIDNDIIEFSTKDPDKDLPKIISKLNENSIEVLAINTTKSSLEEVFVKLTND